MQELIVSDTWVRWVIGEGHIRYTRALDSAEDVIVESIDMTADRIRCSFTPPGEAAESPSTTAERAGLSEDEVFEWGRFRTLRYKMAWTETRILPLWGPGLTSDDVVRPAYPTASKFDLVRAVECTVAEAEAAGHEIWRLYARTMIQARLGRSAAQVVSDWHYDEGLRRNKAQIDEIARLMKRIKELE
jgi:hypothetical protein